jgi:hypothetical protein
MEAVDMALCLAVDVSASVDYDEFGLMIGGLAGAFRQKRIVQAITAGPHAAIAVTVLFWTSQQEVAVPWLRISDAATATALADAIESSPRLPAPGATALGPGMAAGLALLGRFESRAERLVMDVSGDGRHNLGRPPGPVRDIGVHAGVTINGLAMLNEEPDLLAHYEAEVIGGPGAFAMSCADYADFTDAIQRKLFREIRGGGMIA